MKASQLAVDPAAIEGGEWIDDIPGCGDLRIKSRGAGNTDWRKVQQRELTKLTRDERRGQLAPEIQDRILATTILEAGLLDWENLVEDDGTAIAVSSARDMLFDPKWANLLAACAFAANEVASRTVADRKEAEKNSSPA